MSIIVQNYLNAYANTVVVFHSLKILESICVCFLRNHIIGHNYEYLYSFAFHGPRPGLNLRPPNDITYFHHLEELVLFNFSAVFM